MKNNPMQSRIEVFKYRYCVNWDCGAARGKMNFVAAVSAPVDPGEATLA
jgi:ribosomal protein L30E